MGWLAGQRARSELFTYLVERTAEAGQTWWRPAGSRGTARAVDPEESAAARGRGVWCAVPDGRG